MKSKIQKILQARISRISMVQWKLHLVTKNILHLEVHKLQTNSIKSSLANDCINLEFKNILETFSSPSSGNEGLGKHHWAHILTLTLVHINAHSHACRQALIHPPMPDYDRIRLWTSCTNYLYNILSIKNICESNKKKVEFMNISELKNIFNFLVTSCCKLL
jgi:hypothetical protein